MNEQNNYPLTLEHVKCYLATKQEDEPVGLCLNSMACLLTETLNYIYPDAKPWRVDMGSYCAFDFPKGISMEKEVYHLALIFDHRGNFRFSDPITKRQLRNTVIENATYFAVSDLFTEEQAV